MKSREMTSYSNGSSEAKGFSRWTVVIALVAANWILSGCGAAGGGSGLLDSGSTTASPTPVSDEIAKVTMSIHTDNAPADGEMVNVVVVTGKTKDDTPVPGFTPTLTVATGVEVSCYASNAQGESVCLLKTSTPQTVKVIVSSLSVNASSLGDFVSITFKEKKAQRPGFQVGGSTIVSGGTDAGSGTSFVTKSAVGEFITIAEADSAGKAALKDASMVADDPANQIWYYRLISNLLGTVIWE